MQTFIAKNGLRRKEYLFTPHELEHFYNVFCDDSSHALEWTGCRCSQL